MWRILITLIALVLPATAALAAERVLLLPEGASTAARLAAPVDIATLRKAAAEKGNLPVIVGLRVPFAPEGLLSTAQSRTQRAEIATAASAVRSRFAAATARSPKAFRSYEAIPFMAMEVTPAELERLAADPDVISIVENRRNKRFLAQSLPLVQGDQAHAAGYTGSGQAVAIIDSGVDRNHPFLGSRVVSEACYSTTAGPLTSLCPGGAASSTATGSAQPCRISGCEHGTHVAGIAAGANTSMRGVAPGASIIAIQAFSREGNELAATDADIIAALERVFALRTQFSIAAVNMSLGRGRFFSRCDPTNPAMTAAIQNLRTAGIATIVSSGNEDYIDSIAFPACISSAVSVGAVSTGNWGVCGGQATARDKVACYSNTASFLSLLAPGSPINSSIPNRRFAILHGTSMAAPHVAGAWAVIRQKAPSASVDAILTALRNTGTPVTDYRNTAISTPRINVRAALDRFQAVQQVLTYQRQGTGLGSVSFSPAGSVASCAANCTVNFDSGRVVTLIAAPQSGSAFAGWSGACSGTAGSCSVTMSAARSVTATFTLQPGLGLTYDARGTGTGTIIFTRPAGVAACTGDCTRNIPPGTRVTLKAQAGPNSIFAGWGGACRGKRVCNLTMRQALTVTGTFNTRTRISAAETRPQP